VIARVDEDEVRIAVQDTGIGSRCRTTRMCSRTSGRRTAR